MTEYCPTCKFYQPDLPRSRERDNGIGVCRRYPRIHLQNSNCYYVDVREETDWCGEWRPIDKEIHI